MSEKKKAFSVAEAMVTLLIVSIAISAVAPVFTKRNQVSTGSGSHWIVTRNGSDISRVSGKVGINVPTTANPSAMLDIRHPTEDFIVIKKDDVDVFTLNRNGTLLLNIPSAVNRRAVSVMQNGTETAWVDSNGEVSIRKRTDGTRALRIYDSSNNETAWINSNGNSSFGVPEGAVMFFDRPCAEVDGVWHDVPDAWKGRYPRIVGAYKVCDISGESVSTGDCIGTSSDASIGYGSFYGDAIRNISGWFGQNGNTPDSQLYHYGSQSYNVEKMRIEGAAPTKTSMHFDASRVVPTASENRVKSVGLYMCIKG